MTSLLIWFDYNLVPRVSLLCLPWSLEERPWLRLVRCPPRILVAKESVGWERWQRILFGCCGKLCGFAVKFADEECYTISAVFKIQKTFVHKEIWQPNGAETSWLLANVKGHVPIEVKPVDQPLESLKSEVIHFLLWAVFWKLKLFLSYGWLAENSDVHLIYSNAEWFTVLFCWH